MLKIGTKMTEEQEKALETVLAYDADHRTEVDTMPDNPYDRTVRNDERKEMEM